jgi:hypothetical protein
MAARDIRPKKAQREEKKTTPKLAAAKNKVAARPAAKVKS